MQINTSNELLFRGAADQDALYEVHRVFRRNEGFADISFDEYVLRIQEDLKNRTGLGDYVGPVSPEELEAHIAETETDFLHESGKSSGADKNTEAGLAASLRKLAVFEQDVTYVLPPKWTPVVLVGSIVLCGTFKARRDDLLQLMIDGSFEITEIDQAITDGAVELGIEPLSREQTHDVNTMLAQVRFDRVKHATSMLITLAQHFKQ